MNYLGIDLHKRESQVAVVNENDEVAHEVRVLDANLETVAEEYAGNEAAIEATGNYFTVYDTLDEHFGVVLVNPLKTRWLAAFVHYYTSQRPNQALDDRRPVEMVMTCWLDCVVH